MITKKMTDFVFDEHSHHVLQWSLLDNSLGFIDGTVRPICKPATHQRVVYNGDKRIHA